MFIQFLPFLDRTMATCSSYKCDSMWKCVMELHSCQNTDTAKLKKRQCLQGRGCIVSGEMIGRRCKEVWAGKSEKWVLTRKEMRCEICRWRVSERYQESKELSLYERACSRKWCEEDNHFYMLPLLCPPYPLPPLKITLVQATESDREYNTADSSDNTAKHLGQT